MKLHAFRCRSKLTIISKCAKGCIKWNIRSKYCSIKDKCELYTSSRTKYQISVSRVMRFFFFFFFFFVLLESVSGIAVVATWMSMMLRSLGNRKASWYRKQKLARIRFWLWGRRTRRVGGRAGAILYTRPQASLNIFRNKQIHFRSTALLSVYVKVSRMLADNLKMLHTEIWRSRHGEWT